MSTANIKVLDKQGNPVKRIYCRFSYASQNEEQAWFDGFTDDDGSMAREMLPDNSYRVYVNTRNVNSKYSTIQKEFSLPQSEQVVVELPFKELQRVHIDGDKLRLEDNSEFKWNMSSNFMLAQRVAEGEDILPLIHKTGGSRITGIYKIIAEQVNLKAFNPDNYPNWLDSIEKCIDIHASVNKFVQLNVYCDMQYLGWSVSRMRQVLSQVDEMIKPKKNVFGSLGNENQVNGFDANDFTKPVNSLWACGSGLTGGPAPLSNGKAWDIQHQHLRRDIKMFIDIPPVDAPTYSLNPFIIFDETIGWAEFDDSGRRTTNLDWAKKMGAVMRAFNGGTIHLNEGIHSLLLGDKQKQAVDAFNEGMLSE